MTITDHDFEVAVRQVLAANTDDFLELAAMAGLDPAIDFRYANLSGIDFCGADLSGYDLTGAHLENCEFVGARIARAKITIDESNILLLSRAADWEEVKKERRIDTADYLGNDPIGLEEKAASVKYQLFIDNLYIMARLFDKSNYYDIALLLYEYATRALRTLSSADPRVDHRIVVGLRRIGAICRMKANLEKVRNLETLQLGIGGNWLSSDKLLHRGLSPDQEALSLCQLRFGQGHIETGFALLGVGQWEVLQGEHESAIEKLYRARAIFRRVQAVSKAVEARCTFALVLANMELGKIDETNRLFDEATGLSFNKRSRADIDLGSLVLLIREKAGEAGYKLYLPFLQRVTDRLKTGQEEVTSGVVPPAASEFFLSTDFGHPESFYRSANSAHSRFKHQGNVEATRVVEQTAAFLLGEVDGYSLNFVDRALRIRYRRSRGQLSLFDEPGWDDESGS